MFLVGIDPGLCTGFAGFRVGASGKGVLVAAGILDGAGVAYEPDMVCCERPVIYPGGRQKARPKDIITLALRAGEVVGKFGAPCRYVEPYEWKRNLPKDVCHQRIVALLSEEEYQVLGEGIQGVPDSKAHNVLDAVGIGMFYLGRKVFT